MSKALKTTLTLLILVIILGIAFYPRIKKALASSEGKDGKGAGNAASVGGGGNATSGSGAPGAKPNGSGGKTAVSVVVVKPQPLNDVIKSTGTILANEEVELRSEISGRIVQLSLREGDYVKKGTVLLKIFDEDLQAQLKKLEYSKKLAEENEYRQKKLLEKEAISQREYDVAVTSVNTLQADIENIKAQLSKTILKAPFDGTIGLRYVSEGSYISPSTRIANLTNLNPAKLDFAIPAKYAPLIRKGSKIQFNVENSESVFTGTVYAIDPKIDPQTRTLQLRATSPNGNRALIPGSFARIELIMGTKGNAIVVPTEAIIPDVNGHKVFLVKGGKSVPQAVELGIRGDKEVEIKKGLTSGDTVITVGILQVKPDGEVEIKGIRN
ncbi:MAG: efflux RND transporter periplasmic adaptor subunit [Spirosomataceae bacterium]